MISLKRYGTIHTDQQYHIALDQAQRFKSAIDVAAAKRPENPLLYDLEVTALQSQLDELRTQISEYEAMNDLRPTAR